MDNRSGEALGAMKGATSLHRGQNDQDDEHGIGENTASLSSGSSNIRIDDSQLERNLATIVQRITAIEVLHFLANSLGAWHDSNLNFGCSISFLCLVLRLLKVQEVQWLLHQVSQARLAVTRENPDQLSAKREQRAQKQTCLWRISYESCL